METNKVVSAIEEAIKELERQIAELDRRRAGLMDDLKRHKKMLRIALSDSDDAGAVSQGQRSQGKEPQPPSRSSRGAGAISDQSSKLSG